MNIEDLLITLKEKKININVIDGKLKIRAPRGAIDKNLDKLLKENRHKLLSELQSKEPIENINKAQVNSNKPLKITPELLTMVELKQEQIDSLVQTVPGGAANIQDIYPLGPLQEGLLFHHLLQDKGDAYLTVASLAFDSEQGLTHFVDALNHVIARHDIFRTAILWEDTDEPVQLVWRSAQFELEMLEFSDGSNVGADLLSYTNPLHYRLDVRQAPMLKGVAAYDQSNERWQLQFLYHHLIMDHTSLELLLEEVMLIQQQRESELTTPVPFRNFVAQARLGMSQQEHDTFFSHMLHDVDEPTAPFGLLDIQNDGSNIVEAQLAVDKDLALRIRQQVKQQGVSAASLFHLAWALVLAKTSGREDVVFGTVLFGRFKGGAGSERAMGMFINTLPLRIDMSNSTVEETLRATYTGLTELLKHEHASLARAQKCSGVQAPTPLFSAFLNYRYNIDLSSDSYVCEGMTVLGDEDKTNYPFDLSVDDFSDGFHLTAQVDKSICAQRICGFMHVALESVVIALENGSDVQMRSLGIMPEEEIHQQLVEWNDTATNSPKDKCIHELFEQQAQDNPEAIAVVFEGTQLTYGELNAKANQLAHYLIQEKGVKPETLVGLCIERSLDMIVGIMGVLKAGGAYVPLDPSYPAARLEYMLGDANLTTVLTQEKLKGQTPVSDEQSVIIDSEVLFAKLQTYSTKNIAVDTLTSSHLAYVIYTSGSTGNPKGVMVEHSGGVNMSNSQISLFGVDKTSRVLAFASLSFDAAFWEWSMALLKGATLYVCNTQERTDVNALESLLVNKQISHGTLPPAILQFMDVSLAYSLSCLIVAGEACDKALAHIWSDKYAMYNAYGPTETTVCASVGRIVPDSPIHIGRGIDNLGLYVLTEHGGISPIGVAGELHVGGISLARGYLNQEELTREKFIPNPFFDKSNPNNSERLYKTGDLVRYLPDGNVEFLGRIDHQVKIRGFRIELGEVEHQLLTHDEVKDAVVVALSNDVGEKRLVAYVTNDKAASMAFEGQDEENNDEALALRHDFIESLKAALSQDLPDYMVPSVFVVLEQLPLTPNGKVDRKALPKPDMSLQQKAYVAPTTETEKLLCGIWQEVLGLEQVGITDNFFELGGHSLLATRLIATINNRLGVEAPLKLLFNAPTITGFSSALKALTPGFICPSIMPVSRSQNLLPSFGQQRLWLLDKIDGGSVHYNMPEALHLTGSLHVEALTKALTTITERHESLRTNFIEGVDGQPLQSIRPVSVFEIPRTDISLLPIAEREFNLASLVSAEASKPFDLNTDLMLRAQLVKVDEQSHVLLVTMHHIASDGWSMGLLINEFSALYSAYVRGEDNPLPSLEIQYADYAHWQRNWLQGEVLGEQIGYWQQQLAGIPVVHSLPLDKARPTMQSFSGANYGSVIASGVAQMLNSLCQSVGGTLFMGLHAAFSVLLARYSNETDIVVGSPTANREQTEVANLIGFFVNTLVLRSDLSDNPSFSVLLEQSKGMLLDAYAHQQVPFEQLVEKLQPERSLRHSPLFQVMLVLQNNEKAELELPGVTLSQVEQSSDIAQYDLTLDVTEGDDGLYLDWEYNTDLFNGETIERLAKHFELLLTGLVNTPDKSVFSIEMLPVVEAQQQLLRFNSAPVQYHGAISIHGRFEAQVVQKPKAIAAVYKDDSDYQRLSYEQLNQRANQVAAYLRLQGVGANTLVGLYCQRSLDFLVGVLGILKAGGAYVPFDPSNPQERLNYMVSDSQVSIILSQRELSDTLTLPEMCQCIYLDNEALFAEYSSENVKIDSLPDDLAYMIYTSGSTGQPKGALVHHGGALNHIDAEFDLLGFMTEGELQACNFLQSAASSSDVSVWQFLAPVVSGGKTVILDDMTNVAKCLELMQGEQVQLIQTAPVVLQMLLDYLDTLSTQASTLPDLRWLMTIAEACPVPLINRWFASYPNTPIMNGFGPSEASDDITYHIMREPLGSDIQTVPIGKAIPNMNLYVLDTHQQLLPLGVVGELCVSGIGVGPGYWNNVERTDESFIANPFSGEPGCHGERLYRTGDLGRWHKDGYLEFIGRLDNQVKIRGFRVELGEIEASLSTIAGVGDVAVVVAKNQLDENMLAAYIVTKDENVLEVSSLRTQLQSMLPDYMVPSSFTFLASMPLNAADKIDRKALPSPDGHLMEDDYVPANTDSEQMLVVIWANLLKLDTDKTGVTANFFELGGHSLLAIKLIVDIRDKFDVELTVKDIFHLTSIRLLAQKIDDIKAFESIQIQASKTVITFEGTL